jgi:hypothetical protein
MIEQGLFKRHFVGRDGFIWWIGQVAPQKDWENNLPSSPVETNDDIKGFAQRFRVRIMGYHTANIDEIPDNELPWAYVMYPVTAGGGGRSSSQSANITQGTFVFGFFMDGEDAQLPVIMGILGNNEYAAVSKNITKARFIPFSGYTENDNVSSTSLKPNQGGQVQTQDGAENTEGKTENPGSETGPPNNSIVDESATQETTTISAADEVQAEEETEPIAETEDCEPIPTGKIQKEIQNIIVTVQKLQKSIYKYSSAVKNRFSDIQAQITKEIQKATKFIAGGLKWIFTQIQKFVLNTINKELKKTYFLLFPNERPQLKVAVETINDLIACLFRKLIGELLSQMGSFLNDAAKKVINGAECLAESLIGNTLGKILKTVEDTISQALGAITSLIGQAASIAGDILGIITDVLSFLKCDEKPECSKVNEWNILSGPGKVSAGDIESIIGKAKNFAQGAETGFNNIGDSFNLDFSDAFNVSGCDIGPILCGPPIAEFFGSGSGAAGNLIIGAAGEVMGIDMKSFGFGYDDNSFAKVKDQCGKGKGAVIKPIIDFYTDADGNRQRGITDVQVVYSGTGYLSAPDGSRGGNEYTWADPDDTIVKKPDGDYETPRPPGNVIVVNPGDEVILPPGTGVITEPQPGENTNGDGGTGEIIFAPGTGIGGGGTGGTPGTGIDGDGGGTGDGPGTGIGGGGTGGGEEITGGNPVIVTRPGVFTAPLPDYSRVAGTYPTENTGSYPVILYLCEIFIDDSGINYNFEDTVVIEPDIGAKAEAKFDAQGRVVSVKVTEQGEGFREFPRLYIRSETGYNAQLRPKLCIDRVGSDDLKEPQTQDKVISVIDCVGKF